MIAKHNLPAAGNAGFTAFVCNRTSVARRQSRVVGRNMMLIFNQDQVLAPEEFAGLAPARG